MPNATAATPTVTPTVIIRSDDSECEMNIYSEAFSQNSDLSGLFKTVQISDLITLRITSLSQSNLFYLGISFFLISVSHAFLEH